MPHWIIALILGVVEGITEFIPVSSTGHLLIAEKLLRVTESDLFNVVIQCGAVIAVLPLFPQRLYKFVFELGQKETQDYLLKIIIAFAITGAGGLVIDHFKFKLPEELPPVAWALLIGGIAFLAIEFSLLGKKLGEQVTWAVVLAVGLGQLVAAIFPGSSRSGTTIMLSLLLGLSRPA
ncbi:MAG TPA: undecaprenyl-diphosphate phosphatase, partial [Dongiaceae bacterium]|nr:undecaprenyl-diphosphate phosphatase [Dongiaceae bacterium]